MIIKSNTFNYPFKLLAIISILIGFGGIIGYQKLWGILFILIGLIPFLSVSGFELSNDNKAITFYKTYGFFYKSIKQITEVPKDIDYIFFQKNNYKIRYLWDAGNPYLLYKTKIDFRIFLVQTNAEKIFVKKFLDNYEGYKVAKYLSDKLGCKLVEGKRNDDKIERDDNKIYTKKGKDRTNGLTMINKLSEENK